MQHNIEKFRLSLVKNQLSPNTIKAYIISIYTYLNIYKEINADNVLSYYNYLIANYSPKSVNLKIIAFNKYLSYVGKNEYRLRLLKCRESSYLDNIVSFEEYQYFKDCLSKDKDLKWYFIIWTLASTGVRISELVQFNVRDFQKGYIDVQSKGNKIRRVFVPKSIQEQILNWFSLNSYSNGPAFIGNNGKALSIRGISKGLERAAKRYKIDKHLVHPHAFRHLFAKKFLEKNGDIALLADLLGHESLDTTKIYLRRSSQEQKKMIDDIVEW